MTGRGEMKKLLIMTPAYNEEKKIGEILEGIKNDK